MQGAALLLILSTLAGVQAISIKPYHHALEDSEDIAGQQLDPQSPYLENDYDDYDNGGHYEFDYGYRPYQGNYKYSIYWGTLANILLICNTWVRGKIMILK